VRVRDVVTEARPLAADFAVGSHGILLNIDWVVVKDPESPFR